MLNIFRFLGLLFCGVSQFIGTHCMEQGVAACVNVANSTNETVRLSYIKSNADISSITKSPKDWSGKVIQIEPGRIFLLFESFPDFNQFGGEEMETEMCRISIEYEKVKVSDIILVRSMYSPCPFFKFVNTANRFGIMLSEEYPVGGGVTTFDIIHFSQNHRK